MVTFQFSKVIELLPQIIGYLPTTIFVLLLSAAAGTLLGALLTKWRLGQNRFAQRAAEGYIFILRCTPPIILLFIVYYGLPKLLLETAAININDFHKAFFVVISFILLFAASASEIFRSAYLAIDYGQTEAALANGLSEWQAFYRIILPQATVVALPNYCNSFVSLMKDGSLAYTIGLVDIMGQANLIIGRNYGNYALETYVAAALIYLLLVIGVEQLFRLLENRLSRSYRTARQRKEVVS